MKSTSDSFTLVVHTARHTNGMLERGGCTPHSPFEGHGVNLELGLHRGVRIGGTQAQGTYINECLDKLSAEGCR